MPRTSPRLIIDARPRGSRGPLAVERVMGRPVLAHVVEMAAAIDDGPLTIHARADEVEHLRLLLPADGRTRIHFATGPPPEGHAVLRTDRIYDPNRLRRVLKRGRDPERAVIWRLDAPAALAGVEDEVLRRRTYQPLGKFWALWPARRLARLLRPTRVRPNAVTLAAASLVLGASGMVAWGPGVLRIRLITASALALALVLDTADGHLARLQGTASEFGRWLDALLDELGDMALHAAIAWSAYARSGQVGWLLLGMLYPAGKYLFVVGAQTRAPARAEGEADNEMLMPRSVSLPRRMAHWAGHADVRWHLWILLAALGRLDAELVAYALYYPARAAAGACRKAVARG